MRDRLGLLVMVVLVLLIVGWLTWMTVSDVNCDGAVVVRAWPPGTACVVVENDV